MSRSNPYKKKKRYAKKTLLILGEGPDEEMFLKHLRGIYSFNSSTNIKIRKGKGGSAYNIVMCAVKSPGAFDRRIVIIDNDKPEEEMIEARNEAENQKIKLIEHTPCLEHLLLSILENKPRGKNSAWCKSRFESKYMSNKKRREPKEYDKVFPKKLLDESRINIPDLEKLISVMERN